jgi:hypothetical protein
MLVLALTLGATLGAAAPSAHAASIDITVDLAAGPPAVMTVAGIIRPVELVGQYVTFTVQRKSRGRWTRVSSPKLPRMQVEFQGPKEWMGKFNSWFDLWGLQTGVNQKWEGNVLFGSPQINLTNHWIDYTLISSDGRITSEGELSNGGTYSYLGLTPLSQYGDLRWYFAAFTPDSVPGDSYWGKNYHWTGGVYTVVEPPKPARSEPLNEDSFGIMWDATSETRPVLDFDQHMRGGIVRSLPYPIPGEEGSWVSEWDLAPPSDQAQVDPYAKRFGNIQQTCSFAAGKGVYRVQAVIGKLRSPWSETMTVK